MNMTKEMKRSIRLVIVSMALCVPLAGGMYEAQAAPPPPGWYDNRPTQDGERKPMPPAHRPSVAPPPAHRPSVAPPPTYRPGMTPPPAHRPSVAPPPTYRPGMTPPPTHRPNMAPPPKKDKDAPPPMGPGFPRR